MNLQQQFFGRAASVASSTAGGGNRLHYAERPPSLCPTFESSKAGVQAANHHNTATSSANHLRDQLQASYSQGIKDTKEKLRNTAAFMSVRDQFEGGYIKIDELEQVVDGMMPQPRTTRGSPAAMSPCRRMPSLSNATQLQVPSGGTAGGAGPSSGGCFGSPQSLSGSSNPWSGMQWQQPLPTTTGSSQQDDAGSTGTAAAPMALSSSEYGQEKEFEMQEQLNIALAALNSLYAAQSDCYYDAVRNTLNDVKGVLTTLAEKSAMLGYITAVDFLRELKKLSGEGPLYKDGIRRPGGKRNMVAREEDDIPLYGPDDAIPAEEDFSSPFGGECGGPRGYFDDDAPPPGARRRFE